MNNLDFNDNSGVYTTKPRRTTPRSRLIRGWYRLLFILHLRNQYPTYLTGLYGMKVDANVIRMKMTDNASSFITPLQKESKN